MEILLAHPSLNQQFVHATGDELGLVDAARILGVPLKQHLTTSCFATAGAIRWLISDTIEWTYHGDVDDDDDGLDVDTDDNDVDVDISDEVEITPPNTPLYQVFIGESFGDFEHVLTVFGNDVYQSYWRHSPIYKRTLSDVGALLASINTDAGWSAVTGFDDKPSDHMRCFYMVPPPSFDTSQLAEHLASRIQTLAI